MRAPCPNCGDVVDRVELSSGLTLYGCGRCCPTERYVIPVVDQQQSRGPDVVRATVRDGGDRWDIECRFDDGQKFAAVQVDRDFDRLACRIAAWLSTPDRTEELERSIRMLLEENARLVKAVNDAPEFLEAVKIATAGELKEIDGLRAVVEAVRTWSKIRHRSAADDQALYQALTALDAPTGIASVACRFCDEFNPADASRCHNCADPAWKPSE